MNVRTEDIHIEVVHTHKLQPHPYVGVVCRSHAESNELELDGINSNCYYQS